MFTCQYSRSCFKSFVPLPRWFLQLHLHNTDMPAAYTHTSRTYRYIQSTIHTCSTVQNIRTCLHTHTTVTDTQSSLEFYSHCMTDVIKGLCNAFLTLTTATCYFPECLEIKPLPSATLLALLHLICKLTYTKRQTRNRLRREIPTDNKLVNSWTKVNSQFQLSHLFPKDIKWVVSSGVGSGCLFTSKTVSFWVKSLSLVNSSCFGLSHSQVNLSCFGSGHLLVNSSCVMPGETGQCICFGSGHLEVNSS